MPNTEVKLSSAENTWMETSWEDREVLAFYIFPNSSVGTATAVVVHRATEHSEALGEMLSAARGVQSTD